MKSLPWRGRRAQSTPPRRDVVASSEGQMRDERRAAPACSVGLTCALVSPGSPCLHFDQGGENSDDAFPLVDLAGRCVNHLPLLLELKNQPAA